MENESVRAEQVLTDYPRIDDRDGLAWDMAKTEKRYRNLGYRLVQLGKEEEFEFAGAKLKEWADEVVGWGDVAASAAIIEWFLDPTNQEIDKLRQASFAKFDELDAQGIDPSSRLTAAELLQAQPFLFEWYDRKVTENKPLNRKASQRRKWKQTSRQKKHEYEHLRLYLPVNSLSADERSVRLQIFNDYPEVNEPPAIIANPNVVSVVLKDNFNPVEIRILCERLGLKVSKNTNPRNVRYGNTRLVAVSPHSYEEISQRYKKFNLTIDTAYSTIQSLMTKFDQLLKSALV